MEYFSICVALAVGAIAGAIIMAPARRSHEDRTLTFREAFPNPLVQPETPVTCHIRHAADALTERDLDTDASVEDALNSAEFFIQKAREESARQKDAKLRPLNQSSGFGGGGGGGGFGGGGGGGFGGGDR